MPESSCDLSQREELLSLKSSNTAPPLEKPLSNISYCFYSLNFTLCVDCISQLKVIQSLRHSLFICSVGKMYSNDLINEPPCVCFNGLQVVPHAKLKTADTIHYFALRFCLSGNTEAPATLMKLAGWMSADMTKGWKNDSLFKKIIEIKWRQKKTAFVSPWNMKK